jgi:hypothetical protein
VTFDEASNQEAHGANTAAVRDVTLGQVSFAFFIAICVALHPGFVLKSNEGGLSNFGVHTKTVLPYSLALALAAGFSLRAASLLRGQTTSSLRVARLLRTYGALIVLTLVTTYGYTLNTGLKDLHVGVGVVITVFEFVASLWMYRELRSLHLVAVVELCGFVLAVLTFFGVLHVLFLTQLLIGGSFALFLVKATRTLT